MRHLFAAVLAAACVVGATSSFARGGFGHGAGHGGFVRNPIILGAPAPQMPAFENRIPAPLPPPAPALSRAALAQVLLGWQRRSRLYPGKGADLGSIETPTQSVRAFIPKLVYGTRLSVPRHSLRRPAGGWNSRGRIRWSMQPNIGRWQRSSIAWPACAGHLSPASSACAWRRTSSRLRMARNVCTERVRGSMRAISRPSDNPRRIGLSLKGVYALKVGYAETHSCPRPGSATVSFAARAIARRP